jgi:tripartite-type tricarboxylate transporter receptor subunit TctC
MKSLARRALLAALPLCSLTTPLLAQEFPTRTVRIVVPSTPGGSLDVSGRLVAKKLEERWNSSVIVENKPGSNTMLGSTFVASAPADGYTLLIQAPAFIHKVLYKDPPIDVMTSLTVVGPVYSGFPLAFVVSGALPVKNIAEFVAYAKANPGKLNYGTAQGTTTLLMEAFSKIAGFEITKIDYKGSTQALTALLANDVQASISNPSTTMQHIQSGKLRMLAIAGDKRMTRLPDIATMPELGYPLMRASILTVMFGPANMPNDLVNKLYPAIRDASNGPDLVKALDDAVTPMKVDRPELIRIIQNEINAYVETARVGNYKP